MKLPRILLSLAALLLLNSCVNKVQYSDASGGTPLSTRFSASDVQQNVIVMVDSMLSNPVLTRKIAQQFPDVNKLPTISVTHIRNETTQLGLNLRSLSDSIRTKLINSGRFEFIDTSSDAEMTAELLRDSNNPLVAEDKAVQFGQHDTADYILNGTLVEMREEAGRVKQSYYKLNMQLINKRTGRLDWADEKEISKTRVKPVFGL